MTKKNYKWKNMRPRQEEHKEAFQRHAMDTAESHGTSLIKDWTTLRTINNLETTNTCALMTQNIYFKKFLPGLDSCHRGTK